MTPNSRSYLNRWAQPDPIIPSPGNPLDWDRYQYVRSNPLKYNDPSGHTPQCGPDGIFCDSSGHLLSNSKLYDALVDFGWFAPMPDPSSLYDPRYNTMDRVLGVIANYDSVRKALFSKYGWGAFDKFFDQTGKLFDNVFMAMIAVGEFATETGAAYLESIEALSNQYYGDATTNPGPMQCKGPGHCTLAQQLLWATQMQAWYTGSFVDQYIKTGAWMSQLGAGQMAMDGYHYGADTSWFWGDVSESELNKYSVVVSVYHDPAIYPGKPYFIVYE